MNFEKNSNYSIGFAAGYLSSYLIFTTVLYLMISFLGKLPDTWNYMNIMTLTLIVAVTGVFLKRILK